MGGRLLDWLGQDVAANRPAAASMAALIVPNSTAFYYAWDTQILSVYDQDAIAWFDIDIGAISALSFAGLPDVDWSTPPTDGQIFSWSTANSKLEPITPPVVPNTETIQDIVGAMVLNGTAITWIYDDASGTIQANCSLLQYTDEMAMDAIAAMLTAGAGVTVAYNDGANTFTISCSITQYTNAMADARIALASIDALADVDTTTTAPTNGQTLSWSTAASKWLPATTSSGVPWSFRPPLAAAFTLFTGDATAATLADDADVGLGVTTGAAATGSIIRGGYKSLPAVGTDFSVTAHCVLNCSNVNFTGGGLGVYESATGKGHFFQLENDSAGNQLRRCTIAGAFSTNTLIAPALHDMWFRITRVGTNLNFYTSSDGKNFVLIQTAAQNVYMTTAPDRICLYVFLGVGTSIPILSVPYWSQSF